MKIVCPKCRMAIGADRLNVATDVAVCDRCDEAFSLSSLVAGGELSATFDVHQPPPGAWCEVEPSMWRIGATTRALGSLIFMIPFAGFWITLTVGGMYGGQLASGKFSLVLSVFGIPFLLASLAIVWTILMAIAGRVDVTTEGDRGAVFVGVGPVGWTRRFQWSAITAVVEEDVSGKSTRTAIALVGQSRLRFGTDLSDERRYYILQALRGFLADRVARIDDRNSHSVEPPDDRIRASGDR